MYTGVNVEMHIGSMIDASQYSMETRDKLMRSVEIEMRQLLDQSK